MQRRDLRVGAWVREVDREPGRILAQRLAAVEVPSEERVDGECGVDEVLALIVGDAAVVAGVSVVQGSARVIADDPDLRPEADATDEQIVWIDGLLEVHQVRAALVVQTLQVLGSVDAADPCPPAAVVRLDVHRVADLFAQFGEVEHLCVSLERDLEVGFRVVLFRRHHPRRRNRHTKPHHGAVRRVLLVGLDRPRVVEDV